MGKDPLTRDIVQPTTLTARNTVAKTCCTALKITIPMVVDDMNDRVGHAYSGMPDRLYVIDHSGKVAYKGGRGPFGFKPFEMEQSVIAAILESQQRQKSSPVLVPNVSR